MRKKSWLKINRADNSSFLLSFKIDKEIKHQKKNSKNDQRKEKKRKEKKRKEKRLRSLCSLWILLTIENNWV